MVTPVELTKLIDNDKPRLLKLQKQCAYVEGNNPAILSPYPKEDPDNRIPVPFARRAVNMVLGYMFKPGNITYRGDGYDPMLKDAFDTNDEGLLNMELAHTLLSHGEAFELHWTEGSKDQFAQVPIFQSIPLYNVSIRPKMIGFVRYWCDDTADYAEAYDNRSIQKFKRLKKYNEVFTLDGDEVLHGYGRVPIVKFTGNKQCENIFDHVVQLIDFYDKIMSEDFANELARFASAYMLMGGKLDEEVDGKTGLTEIDRIKEAHIFQGLGLDRSVTDSIAFLTKDINDKFINSAADRTERLIYEMLQLFNPNDQTFGTASGVAQKYKLLSFEYLCTGISTYFQMGLQDRIATIKKINENLAGTTNHANTAVTIFWKRNLPDDLLQLSTIASTLQNILSRETIIRLFPDYVVDDVEAELKAVESEVKAAEKAELKKATVKETDPTQIARKAGQEARNNGGPL